MSDMGVLEVKGPLAEGSILISIDKNGPTWRYPGCSMSHVFVEGGIRFIGSSFFQFVDLRALHDAIGDEVLKRDAISAEAFRFLRKEMLLTADEAAILCGIECSSISAWEAGEGFTPNNVAPILEIYSQWRRDRKRPEPQLEARVA